MNADATEKYFALADKARSLDRMVVRDDQYDLQSFLDAGRTARGGLRLVDSGRFSPDDLELLLRAGTSLYTSLPVRTDRNELGSLVRTAAGSGAVVAMLVERLPVAAEEKGPGLGLDDLVDLVAAGLDLHVTDGKGAVDPACLIELAAAAKRGKGRLVLYHHGPVGGELAAIGAAGAWIHFRDASIVSSEDAELAAATAAACRKAGTRAVVHVARGLGLDVLKSLQAAGALLNFLTPPSGPASLLKAVEDKAAGVKIPVRAYYLTLTFMP